MRVRRWAGFRGRRRKERSARYRCWRWEWCVGEPVGRYGGDPACTLTPDSGCAGTGYSQLVRFSPGTGTGGSLTVTHGSWTIQSGSQGSIVLDTVMGIPDATDTTLVLTPGALHATIVFRFDAGSVTVSFYSIA